MHPETGTKFSRRTMLAMIGAISLAPGTALAQSGNRARVQGNVRYRERMLLPRGAVVEVSLIDVSRADARSITIASTRIRGRSGSPIPYRLDYNRARLNRRGTYALQARITVRGNLLFISTSQHRFEPRGRRERMDIDVERVGV